MNTLTPDGHATHFTGARSPIGSRAARPRAITATAIALACSAAVVLALVWLLSDASRPVAPAQSRMALAGAMTATLGASDPAYAVRADGSGAQAGAPAQRLSMRFTGGGTTFSYRGGGSARLSLAPAGSMLAAPAAPSVSANTASISHGPVTETYANGPLGVEQSFKIARPLGSAAVQLRLDVSGASAISPDGEGGALLRLAGGGTLRYGAPTAVDASGRALPARLRLGRASIDVLVEARGAAYPLTVDPLVQGGAGSQLTGGSEEMQGGGSGGPRSIEGEAKGQLGYSVALSADGNTAAVGAPEDQEATGAVWVFTRGPGGVWSQQGPKLTPAGLTKGINCESAEGEPEEEECSFGRSVAISADGNTILAGAPRQSGPCTSGTCVGVGAVWVYTRSAGAWSVGQVLVGGPKEAESGHPGEGGRFGRSVAISADGTVAAVGATAEKAGSGGIWVFSRTGGGSFPETGTRLATGSSVSTQGHLGASVALSSHGTTLVGGAPGDKENRGSARVFTYSGSAWEEAGKLVGAPEESGAGRFGFSTAISEDGSTILVGARADATKLGAAWVFRNEAGAWKDQSGKLTGGAEQVGPGEFGSSVALSGDGSRALIGALRDRGGIGAAWLYVLGGAGWSQEGAKLDLDGVTRRSLFGASIAMRPDGGEALIGAPVAGNKAGLAWVYYDPAVLPAVEAISPSAASVSGGERVTISGQRLASALRVDFGSAPAQSFTVNSSQSITAVVPAHAPGPVCVRITTIEGVSPTGGCPNFTYLSLPGPPIDGQAVAGQGALGFNRGPAGAGCTTALVSRLIPVVSGKRAQIRLRASGRGSCSGSAVLRVRTRAGAKLRTVTIGSASYTIAAGATATVSARMTASGSVLLKRSGGRLAATLQVLPAGAAARSAGATSVRLVLARRAGRH